VEPLSRPASTSSLAERVRAWIEWFGIGRLVAASLATVVVCAGAFWLIRSPPPPTEASLPMAATTTVADKLPAPQDPTTTMPSTVLVHVAGAVIAPGVYELRPGDRVSDAIVAAGGPTEVADWNAVNLAAEVADATRIYVPVVGEDPPAEVVVGSGPGLASAPPGPVDVNRANADELDELPGVGPATASAILTERERNGPFVDVDDLARVPGIGPAKLDALRGLVTT
jgi:competence protein ComEA